MLLTEGRVDTLRRDTVLKGAHATVGAAGETVFWTPATGKRFRLRKLYANSDQAGAYQLRDGATTIAYFYLPANVWTLVLDLAAEIYGYWSAAAGNTLRFYVPAMCTFDVLAVGNEE